MSGTTKLRGPEPLALKMSIAKYEVLYQKEEEFQIGPQIYTDKHRSVKICVNPWLNCVSIACEQGGSDWGAVETEFRGYDLGGFEAGLKGPAFYFMDDWVED